MRCQKVFIQHPHSRELWKSKFGISLKYVKIIHIILSFLLAFTQRKPHTRCRTTRPRPPPFHPSRRPRPQRNLANQQLTVPPMTLSLRCFTQMFHLRPIISYFTLLRMEVPTSGVSNSIFQKSDQRENTQLACSFRIGQEI